MKLNSIQKISHADCTGCGACYNICPKNAIEMKLNDEGFWAPFLSEENCVDCGKCIATCPAIDILKFNNPEPDCYVAIAADEKLRMKSSSGGIFGILADYVLEQNGYVCGAAYTPNFLLEHVIVDNKKDLEKLRGSKYLQSNTKDCFNKIKELLEEKKMVLYCSTPCQVAGLNKFLNKNYDTLITVDLLCHGGPSPNAFKKYLAETYPNKKIKDYKFRDKSFFGWVAHENIYFKNGKEVHIPREVSPYFRAFLPCFSVRESCGTCKASSLPRQGDFTLGDAWEIHKINKDYSDGKGTSIVSINNDKAKSLIGKIREKTRLFETIPLEWVLTHGQPFARPFKPTSIFRHRFFEMLPHNTFERAVEYTEQGKYDVAVVGVWYGWNYGSLMTYYSIYNFLTKNGYLTLMVDKPILHENDIELDPNFHSRKFCIKHYRDRMSHPRPPKHMWELNRYADTFLLGSDQVLHYNLMSYTQNTHCLNFVEDSKKKIAFSSSFGHEKDSNKPEERGEIGRLLRRFDYIGLREESGVDIMKKNYGVNNATTVMDAIFLSEPDLYKKIAAESNKNETEPFIATYILDPNSEIKKALLHISEKLNCKLINLLDGAAFTFDKNEEALGLPGVKNLEVHDWLYYLINAKFIITDSYHGTCFSILFNKDFITIGNKKRGLTRFKMVLGITKLENRYVSEPAEILENENLLEHIDYEYANSVLNIEIEKTKKWLLDALAAPKEIRNSAKYYLDTKNIYTHNEEKIKNNFTSKLFNKKQQKRDNQ